jgi:CrcB protein
MKLLLAIAAGGAFGAVGRYLVMSQVGHWLGTGFPWGTLTVNVVGSVAMGVIVELGALVWSPSPEMRAFLVVGTLGAFTTFSTFSLDAVVLIERNAFVPMALYITLSVFLCLVGLFFGMTLTRMLAS